MASPATVASPAAADRAVDDAVAMLLELAKNSSDAEVAWTTTLDNGIEVVDHLAGDDRHGIVAVGLPTPVDAVTDTVLHRRADDHRISADLFGPDGVFTAFAAVPIRSEIAGQTGTLCCATTSADSPLAAADGSFLAMIAEAIATARSDAMSVGEFEVDDVRVRVEATIAAGTIEIAHQPIVGLIACNVVGSEALARFASPPNRPDLWFADAASVGLGVELELAAVRCAIANLGRVPASSYLAVNVGPDAITSPEFLDIVEATDSARIVIELTEHAAIDDYSRLQASIERLRSTGARLAIDDVGAGYSSFNHVLSLQPDIVKLDMSITRDIDSDVARRGLARGLLGVAHDIGATVVAEGVESQAELDTLVDIGVDAAQGYFLARPGPLPLPDASDLPRPAPRRIGDDRSISDPRDALAHLARVLLGTADLELLTRPILTAVLDRTGLETSYLTVKDSESGALEHRYVLNAGTVELPEGIVLPWSDTLCKRSREAGLLWTADVPRDLPGCEAAEAFGVKTFISIPIQNDDGSDFGTLCAASTETRTLDHTSVTEVGTLAALIADHNRRDEPEPTSD